MAQVAHSCTIQPANCELSLRLLLRKAGMRLDRRGYQYRILSGHQVLVHDLCLDEAIAFTNRALVR